MDVYTSGGCRAFQASAAIRVMKVKAGKSSSLGVKLYKNIHICKFLWERKETGFVLQETVSHAHMQMLHICMS